jgi:hypothetical protein
MLANQIELFELHSRHKANMLDERLLLFGAGPRLMSAVPPRIHCCRQIFSNYLSAFSVAEQCQSNGADQAVSTLRGASNPVRSRG